MAELLHISVLAQEVLEFLTPRAGGRYIDATLGAGGHAAEILNASAPNGRLLGLDADPQALAIAAERLKEFGDRVSLQQTNFENLAHVAKTAGFVPADGIFFDLALHQYPHRFHQAFGNF